MLVDQAIWVRLAELTREGLGLDKDGNFPLDRHLPAVMVEQRITLMMVPPRRGSAVVDRQGSGGHQDKNTINQLVQAGINAAMKKMKDKGKGNGGKGKATPPPPQGPPRDPNRKRKGQTPPAMEGLETSFEGKPLCFDFNLGQGCSRSCDEGNRCSRGLHLCAVKDCGGRHSAQEHARGDRRKRD